MGNQNTAVCNSKVDQLMTWAALQLKHNLFLHITINTDKNFTHRGK